MYYIYTLLMYMLIDKEYNPAYKPSAYYLCRYLINKKVSKRLLSAYFKKKII